MDPSGGPDNHELVARCLEGDEKAWRTLVLRYRTLVYSLALRTGLDEEGAQEIFQQVWTELHRSLARLRDPQALPKWLAVSTRRLSYRYAMDRRRWVDGTFDEMVDPAKLPDDEVEDLELRQQIEDGMGKIDERCQELLRLLFFHSPPLSYPEISAKVGIARGSIGPIRARCLGRLRKVMEDRA